MLADVTTFEGFLIRLLGQIINEHFNFRIANSLRSWRRDVYDRISGAVKQHKIGETLCWSCHRDSQF